jgi:hypothetical protein
LLIRRKSTKSDLNSWRSSRSTNITSQSLKTSTIVRRKSLRGKTKKHKSSLNKFVNRSRIKNVVSRWRLKEYFKTGKTSALTSK